MSGHACEVERRASELLAESRNGTSPEGEGARSVLTRVADVEAERVRWLWPLRLPVGKLVVVDGDPALGKSTLTLDWAARVTTGSPWPDGAPGPEPAAVIVLSAEDGIADTIRPRLEAADADLDRVVVFEGVENEIGQQRPPSLPLDLDRIEHAVNQTGAALVIVDVLAAFLDGSVDSYRDQDVRGALMPLARLAERTGAVVVVLRHLSKSGGANPLYRGGGSIGIIGAARAGMLVARDPDDETRTVLAVTKSNLAPMPPALAYRLVNDPRFDVATVAWDGVTEHRAAELLAFRGDDERGARTDAMEFLRDLLGDGLVPAKDARREANDAGIAPRTLDRAKADLGVRSVKQGSSWFWTLPDAKSAKDATQKTGDVGAHDDVGAYCSDALIDPEAP